MHRPRSQAGFSLIELLVTIGVVLVLIGLALPSLGSSAAHTKLTRSLAELRYCGQLLTLYADDHRDIYPIGDARLFWGMTAWPAALLAGGYIDDPRQLGTNPFGNAEEPPPFAMSACMLGPPEMFSPGMASSLYEALSSGVRQSDVRYPSGKGLLWQWLLTEPSSHTPGGTWCCPPDPPLGPVIFADTSGSLVRAADLAGLPPDADLGIGFPVQSTWFGVLGSDR